MKLPFHMVVAFPLPNGSGGRRPFMEGNEGSVVGLHMTNRREQVSPSG